MVSPVQPPRRHAVTPVTQHDAALLTAGGVSALIPASVQAWLQVGLHGPALSRRAFSARVFAANIAAPVPPFPERPASARAAPPGAGVIAPSAARRRSLQS